MVKFDNISFSYGNKNDEQLKNISFEINRGEFVLICGRSACGKTTVTKCINGLIPHFSEGNYSGTVIINGREVANTPVYAISENVGSVFQNPKTQFFNLDTDSELVFGMENMGTEPEKIWGRVKEVTNDLHIENLLGRGVFELSGGEKQILALASIYAVNPDVYVLDEPTANIDQRGIVRLHDILLKLKQMGKTVIISEHRLYFLMDLIDKAIYIDHGVVREIYTGDEFRNLNENERIRLGLRCFALRRNIKKIEKLTVLGGATEAAIWSNYFDVQFPIPKEWKSIPYGYPLKNQFYRIVDRKNRDCPAWVEGELWIGGVGVGEKYINDEKQTEEHFIEEASMRWYKTGDIGKFWDNGVIEFLGRKDFQVKINGHRIECGEIEAQLREMTEVSDAVVMPVSVGGGKILVAFINYIFSAPNQQMCLLQNDKRIKIQSFLEERLIDYMIPTNFVEVSRIPLSENGKVNRKKLLEDYMRVIGTQKYDDNTQMCDGEKRLAAIWKQVLNLENIGLEDNYFRVGGDSLVAVKLAIKVQEAFGINFKLTDIYMYPTIKSQYKKVQRAITDGCELDSEHKAVLPAIESHFDKMYEEFPLTDIQQAYWLGRKDIYSYGNITTHYYFELDCSNLDIKKAEDSFNSLIMRHPMMRAVLCENGQKQRILRNVPKYVIEIEKLSKMCDSDKNIRLMEVRENYAHKYFLPEKWPLFEIKISELSNTTQRVHICFDNIIFDGRSIFIILNEWRSI